MSLKEASYYTKSENNKVKCNLCPHNCLISDGKAGICKVRTNIGGTLYADVYNKLSAVHFDPVEKKPLYHFYPGKEILSIGGLGCNFKCGCCQNYEISQSGVNEFPRLLSITVNDIIKMVHKSPINIGLAFTYNEPVVWFEYMKDVAIETKKHGLKNVMVSNGYINKKPLEDLLEWIDAFNIDLKVFNEEQHKRFTGGGLQEVFNTLETIVKGKKHLEVTTLVVPGLNDDIQQFEQMIDWIYNHLGSNVPLHISRYFPKYRMNKDATSGKLLTEMADCASEKLSFVYMGNYPENNYQNTICPVCGNIAILRHGYHINTTGIKSDGKCSNCGFKLAIT
ncbi:MAG: AmmeMemoRadiSam system radical SAM enzyme [Bacteroidales bacterium]|nr:AmmeMemoRadiSam system radical SAM enzyme [Bacteroidales bacterium]